MINMCFDFCIYRPHALPHVGYVKFQIDLIEIMFWSSSFDKQPAEGQTEKEFRFFCLLKVVYLAPGT